MRRLVLFVMAVNLAALTLLPVGAATPRVQCSNPTVLTGYQDGIAFPPHYRVNQDVWTGVGKQTMRVCDQTDWQATANQKGQPASGVKAYPASERTYTDWSTCASQPALSSFTKLESTYSHQAPAAGSYDFAYDLFIGSGACSRPLTEIMIFTQWREVSLPTAQLHKTIDGVAYEIYHAPFPEGGQYIQMRLVTQAAGGNVDFVHVFRYLERKGLVVATDTMEFLRYGVEVLTTRGRDVSFALDGFTVADAHT